MRKFLSALILIVPLLAGCREEKKSLPPVISLSEQIYTATAGQEVRVSPEYENCEEATFGWVLDGNTISTEPELVFSSDFAGQYYITVTATNSAGSDMDEIRIDIYDILPPKIYLTGADKGFTVLQDSVLVLNPTVESATPATCRWTIDGETFSTEQSIVFPTQEPGTRNVVFEAENRDGNASVEFQVQVITPSEAPFSWDFAKESFYISSGRNILLAPLDIRYAFDAIYTWTVNGTERQKGENPEYIFAETAEGQYSITVTMTNSYTSATKELTVTVCPPEGTYKRKAGPDSSPLADRIYEYTPAPGQFINDGYTASTPEEACSYAENRLGENRFVSLGAFGGYIIAGFDHSVENSGGYDLQITGNAHSSSSEPGIIWVMQDENGNGLPDDTWYELKGSEYGKPETIQDYAVTYYRPEGPSMAVVWTDNRGNSGTVDYLGAYHRQEYYYPAWIKADSYTLRGTRLQDRLEDSSGNGTLWIGHPFDWGYADNFGGENIDRFRISDAVRNDGTAADLSYIDFVKIQCGVQTKGGWTGEMSTEITLIKDLHIK